MKLFDKRVYKILKYLNNVEYGSKRDILPILSEMFPINNIGDNIEREEKNKIVRDFYSKLISDKLIYADINAISTLAIGRAGQYNWLNDLNPIMTSITEHGERVLETERQRLENLSFNATHVQNNDSIIKKFLSKSGGWHLTGKILYDVIILISAIASIVFGYLAYINK